MVDMNKPPEGIDETIPVPTLPPPPPPEVANEPAVPPGTMEVEKMPPAKPVNARRLSEPIIITEGEMMPEEEQTEEKGAEEAAEEGGEEEEDVKDSTSDEEPVKKKKEEKKKRVQHAMEYDLTDMYPEMSVLSDKKKREWDYQDPETIRALWLESQTNALAEWKIKYTKIKKARKPQIEVRETAAQTLRIEYIKNKQEKLKEADEKDLRIIEKGRETPKFDEVKLPTNTTTDMRYRYNRNNPPVPLYYLEHFDKHKKPPFKIHGINVGCRQPTTGL